MKSYFCNRHLSLPTYFVHHFNTNHILHILWFDESIELCTLRPQLHYFYIAIRYTEHATYVGDVLKFQSHVQVHPLRFVTPSSARAISISPRPSRSETSFALMNLDTTRRSQQYSDRLYGVPCNGPTTWVYQAHFLTKKIGMNYLYYFKPRRQRD